MANDKITRIKKTVDEYKDNYKKTRRQSIIEATHGHQQLKGFEYLIHHIEVHDNGKEVVHHCYLYDHIANLFEQGHMVIKDGKATLDGKVVKDGTYHVIIGLEPTQEVCYSNAEAVENKIRPMKLRSGMTRKQKSKEW